MTHSTISADTSSVVNPSMFQEFWFYFKGNRGAVFGLVVFSLILFSAVFAHFLAPYDYQVQDRLHLLQPPVWQEGGSVHFLLGTDAVGRDILSRLIYGAQYSLFIGLIVVIISMIFGVFFGLVAGYFGGKTDELIMRVMDIILSIPSILLALTLITVLEKGVSGVIVAISIVYQPHFSRLVRAAVMEEKNKEYVTAARLVGAQKLRLMFHTILPNCMAPVIVQGTMSFSKAILDVAALGFLMQGVPPPAPEWGTMLAEAREFIASGQWWVVTFPGLAILITVLSINLIGDGLRDAFDPKMKRS